MEEKILAALRWRYAVKTFDANKKISDADLHTILESGRLAPSSIGIEPWKFIVVTNPGLRTAMRAAANDQTKLTDASHMIVVARRTDAENLGTELAARTAAANGKSPEDFANLRQMVDGAVSMKSGNPAVLDGWLAAQTYIALGVMVETAALLGVDACPMEGFDAKRINEILGLDAKHLSAQSMLALGYRGDDKYAALPKVRRAFDEMVEMMK